MVQQILLPLYSKKLHIRVRRASTSWETSLTILAFSLGDRVVNHFARRYEPVSVTAKGSLGTTISVAYHFALPGQEN
jgi:hypothetical protein